MSCVAPAPRLRLPIAPLYCPPYGLPAEPGTAAAAAGWTSVRLAPVTGVLTRFPAVAPVPPEAAARLLPLYVELPLATGIAPCPAPPPQLLQLCWHPIRSTAAPGSNDETPRTRA